MKFRKKPVEIEAIQFNGENFMQIFEWAMNLDEHTSCLGTDGKDLTIMTLEGQMIARPGDWIIRGIKGEFYPCKPDIFEQTYEHVE